ncbi:hypothetical protein KIW84_051322 [Lathyrus oleraceus]|uniref:Uncharacterized protein n=1 Tax=Pisum sativum TaxID=3888 RepID=A0A9D4WME4_PEA|nr:hypothetical protein KIW84_051322 [Pisum sativum]
MHVPTETSGSSSLTTREKELFQMINLSYLVLDVSPLSTVHPPPLKKATPYVAKNVKTLSKSSEPILPEKSAIYKELRRFVTYILKEVNSNVFPDDQTSLAKESSPDNDSSEKVEESVPEHVAHERRSKKKDDLVVNVEELTSDKEPLTNIVTPSIAKRLQRRKGRVVVFEDSPSREVKRKYGGLKGTPSRSSMRKSLVGPTRSWSKVVTPTRKRKVVSSSESEFDVEKDAPGPATSKKSDIAQLKETCKELEDSIRSSTVTKIKLETLMKAMMEEEKKEIVQGGDGNEGTEDEDYAGEDDADEEKEDEGEEYARADSDSQEDI